ncbi:MAG TPA: ABC transporter substrate-binding protein [Stellaceae bacterium]|jgi:peptide/nickel transport system substrate-binding protein|nr:ABC transporter substrate-binding protein [Stellaceae bacterium]
MKAHSLLFGFGLALLGLLLTTGAEAADFKWANDGDARALDPYTFDETVQNSLLANIYERLVQRNKQLGLEPALALSWENASPTVWRFHLRPNVKWQDGTDFTADDVTFSFQRVTGKNSAMRSQVSTIKAVRNVDDLTVDFETNGADPILPSEITGFDIMSKKWCEEHNVVENVVLGKGENYSLRNTMGTGPFKLVSREPDRRTVLEPNPTWWGKPEHNLTRAEFDIIANASTRVAALLSGEMDMIYSVPPQDMDRIAHTAGVKVLQTPELRTIYLAMDQTRDELLFSNVKGKNPFKDVRVRRAFALAIDEDAIAKRVMRGMAKPTWLMYGPGVNGYDPALDKRPPVDLAKAKELMTAAGYPDGFQLTMDCPNDRYVMDEQICTAIASMLARINVKVDVYARTKVKFFTDVGYPNYRLSFSLQGWTPSTYDAHNVFYTLLASRNSSGRGQGNNGGYSNPKVDELTAEIGHELDKEKRQELINEAAKIVQDDVATIPLHQQVIVWAAHDNVSVVQPADDAFYLRWVNVK